MGRTYRSNALIWIMTSFMIIPGFIIQADDNALSSSLIQNGDFSQTDTSVKNIKGVEGTAYWFFGSNMGGTGGSGKASLDGGALRADIKLAGTAVYAVQLIQAPVEIQQGVRYKVTFDAKASEKRTIDVKVGGVARRQWKDYTKGQGTGRIIDINTDMQTYSFDFVMTGATDPEARLEFQLGGLAPSTIWIDNVRLEAMADDVNAIDDHKTGWTPNPNSIEIPPIVNRGANLPFIQYEAEDADTTGSIIGPDRSPFQIATEATGRRAVQLNSAGEYVEFTLKEPANALVIRYCIPDSEDGKGLQAPLSLFVNGEYRQDVTLSSEFTWLYGNYPGTNNPEDGSPRRFFDEAPVMIGDVPAGSTIRLEKSASNTVEYIIIDLLDAERVPAPLEQPENSLSITEFGAIANDGKDDNRAFLDCMEAAKAAGKGVWIPQGVFNLHSFLPRREIGGVIVQGAGMWYSVLQVKRNAFFGNGERFEIHDVAIFGNTAHRDDAVAESGFRGDLGKGSVIDRVWFHHVKVGVWSEKETDGLIVRNSRFRNLIADGVNLCLGTQNSIVENNHFRGTGDDAIAIWSARYTANAIPSANNTIRFNTVQSTWLANGIAIYGGKDHVVEDNVVYDTVDKGAGINISSMFDPVPFSGSITVQRNTLIRCGSPNPQNDMNSRGAIWIWAANQDIDADLVLRDIDIYDASYAGILIEGRNMLHRAAFENITINGAGTWGIHAMKTARGAATFSDITIINAAQGGLNQEGQFSIEKHSANVGW